MEVEGYGEISASNASPILICFGVPSSFLPSTSSFDGMRPSTPSRTRTNTPYSQSEMTLASTTLLGGYTMARGWGDGIVVSSKLTRSDEEVTIAFRDPQIGRKTLLASLAGLELLG